MLWGLFGIPAMMESSPRSRPTSNLLLRRLIHLNIRLSLPPLFKLLLHVLALVTAAHVPEGDRIAFFPLQQVDNDGNLLVK